MVKDERLKLKLRVNDTEIGLVDTGADVTIISPKSWNPEWLLQKVCTEFTRIGKLFQIRQSVQPVKYVGPEGQTGKLRSYVANIPQIHKESTFLQQWGTQINIPAIQRQLIKKLGEMVDVLGGINMCHQNKHNCAYCANIRQQRLSFQVKRRACAETSTVLPQKWLTDKPVWVEHRPLAKNEALGTRAVGDSTYRRVYLPMELACVYYKKKPGKWRMLTD